MQKASLFVLAVTLCSLMFGFTCACYNTVAPISGGSGEIAVDSEGNIYIGSNKTIYRIGTCGEIDKYTMPAKNQYHFFIRNDKLYYSSYSGKGNGIYDLECNYLKDNPYDYYKTKKISHENRIVQYGEKTYEIDMGSVFSPYEIRCNGETYYRQATLDFLLNGKIVVLWVALYFLSVCSFLGWFSTWITEFREYYRKH